MQERGVINRIVTSVKGYLQKYPTADGQPLDAHTVIVVRDPQDPNYLLVYGPKGSGSKTTQNAGN